MEDWIPESYPLRAVRKLTHGALAALFDDFNQLHSRVGRPGIAPEVMLMRRVDLERKMTLGADKG